MILLSGKGYLIAKIPGSVRDMDDMSPPLRPRRVILLMVRL
jgi:hypothetical protein